MKSGEAVTRDLMFDRSRIEFIVQSVEQLLAVNSDLMEMLDIGAD